MINGVKESVSVLMKTNLSWMFSIVLVGCAITPLAAESYLNPWGYPIIVKAEKGEHLLAVVEKAISLGSKEMRKHMIGDVYHQESR